MDTKLLLQMDHHNKIVKARVNFKKSPKERITETYLEVRLEALEQLWSNFSLSHQDLIVQFGVELQGVEYMKKDIYDKTEEIYIEYKTELKSLLKSSKPKVIESTSSGDKTSSNSAKVQLPKIVIPSFSGQYTEWVTFRDLFVSLIDKNAQLGNVQKLHYLKSYLTGEAEQLLRQIPISDANYERCWTQLKSRYNNKRYLSHHIIKRLLSQRNITVEASIPLKELMDTTNDCLAGLKNLGVQTDNWDILVIHLLTLKLDSESRKQWEFKVTSNTASEELPTYAQFTEFLTQRYRALEFLDTRAAASKPANQNMNNNSVQKVKALHVTNHNCSFCSEAHKLNACKKFVKQNVDQRRNFVQTNKICFNCLGVNHGAKTCLSITKCRLCHRRHHTLLHPKGVDTPDATNLQSNQDTRSGSPSESEPSKAGEIADNTANSASLISCFSTGRVLNQVLLATALVKSKSTNGHSHTLRALLDQGSQASFVTEATVQALKLKKKQVKSKISGLGENKSLISNSIVELEVTSRLNSEVVITVKAHVLKSITTFLPERKVNVVEWPELESLELADPKYHQPNKIDLLLGADVYSQIISEGLRRGPNGSLVAQATSLGWILSGLVGSSVIGTKGVLACHTQIQIQDEDDILKRFWELEADLEFASTHIFTEEERCCEEFFCKTTTRDSEGRYIVRLPFKVADPDCKRGETRFVAEKRLNGLERRLKKDESFNGKYHEVIDEYVQLGHAVIIQEPDERKHKAVYLPHHAVVREDKDTTKVRVVFNASSPGRNGVTLNDCLMVGPTIQPDLRHLVLKWRLHKICIAADIVKMYRQIKMHEDDADFQRFLWRTNPEGKVNDYKLLRVTFGTACAPFLAVRTLQQVALDEGGDYPQAKDRVLTSFYMDDLMTGCETVSEGVIIYKEMSELLNKGGFTLQKWISNDDELLEQIKERGEETKEEINIKMDKMVKVLGLTWERPKDHLRYGVKLEDLEPPVTKRKIIADIARLFDPLGWITPCIITAKVMIQKLWIAGIQWDENVPQNILNEWVTYREGLFNVTNVTVPRWLHTKSDDIQRELHGFCDASKLAYAAVVYLRVIDSEGNIHISLVTAKSKVAPIKQVSIPRLELLGAVMLAKLMLEVAKILQIEKTNLHAWTDSTIVLAWLNSLPIKWKVFVANRVSEILTSYNPKQWSHVASKNNPADCASRGISPSELQNNYLWFDGPEFLKCQHIKYGKPKETTTDLEAIKVHHSVTEPEVWEKFSTLTRLIRVVAYCRRLLVVKKPASERKGYLKATELTEALETCIRKYQWQYFEGEINALKGKEEIKRKSPIQTLNPYLDQQNLLRVGGRLEKAPLETCRKHPIILPKKAHLSSLLVAHGHRQTLHGGVQLTLNYVGSKYYIIGAKQLVKAHIRKCVTCVKNIGLTYNPMMGQLPSVRVTPSRPFRCSGVDFAGPIQIRTAKGRGHKSYKGYICVFVCMSTRALHVEAVSDLTSDGFLQAFKRFTARRGHCQEVWSDNGTNFVGASSELRKLFLTEKASLLPELAETLANNGTSWHFIPPHAPNFGGLWEAGVKSVKYHLKRVIGNSTLTYEELATVLAQIEACLNSRPLSRLENDPANTEVLTPGHFLVGEALLSPPEHNYETSNVSSLKRWEYTQRMYQDFWRKWSQEYLTQFFRRYKWSTPSPQPKTGDVVLVKEDGLPPCRWLYGLVTDEHPGKDGITRVVTIKTKHTHIKRPASKVCILPIGE